MKKLPLGKQTYSKLIVDGFIYIDKTEYLYNMITNGSAYFLSRPRRFGKSLTVSTLKEIFKGNKELFKCTYIYNSDYDWKEHPIVQFDFSKYDADKSASELNGVISSIIDSTASDYNVTLSGTIVTQRFAELLEKLSKTEQVIVLIDEYDNPLISNITDIDKAKKIKDILKGFYKIIKSCDEYVKFAFLTGVTKFSQISVFSGLNNLTDITMDKRYSAICGYTGDDIKISFKDYLTKWSKENEVTTDKILDDIKHWYNGFLFTANGTTVYNPWSVLNFFNTGEFKNYWFETGTPTFLIDLIKKSDSFYLPSLSEDSLSTKSFSTFDIERLQVLPLLFQTGYLTIKHYDPEYDEYNLYFPNREVEDSFIQHLLTSVTDNFESDSILSRLRKSLLISDLEAFFESMDTLISKVDYDLHLKDEKYWQSLFYMILTLLGYKISAEFKTVKGRIDAVIETKTHIYIFEFKTTQSEELALEQIKNREYYKRFKDSDKQIVLVGSRFIVKDKSLVTRYLTLDI